MRYVCRCVSRCRFRDDSPSSEEHSKSWRGGSGHGGRSASGTPDVSCTEGRRLRKCRRDAAALSANSGTRSRQQAATAGASDATGRRDSKKARGAASAATSAASSNSSLDSMQATTAVHSDGDTRHRCSDCDASRMPGAELQQEVPRP
jgi:hypothetical protein